MSVTIAIPEPTSEDTTYNQRTLPLYLTALRSAGATPLVVPLHERQDRVARLLLRVQGILLPGSGFDVDPQRYGEKPIPACGPTDPARTAVDELLLQDAFNLKKPILAICQGMQTLNVWCNGSLIQDLETDLETDFEADGKTAVNHRPGREVVEAHPVRIAENSRLARLLADHRREDVPVNSSHHQAVRVVGDHLRVTAICPWDGVVEAVELGEGDHFVLGVQWHPERTYALDAFSRAIFCGLVQAASGWTEPQIEASVAGAAGRESASG